MKGKIIAFRQSVTRQYNNQMIITIEKVRSKEDAKAFIGKEVIWRSPSGKKIQGKIKALHGNKGLLRVLFEKGMPGQSINKDVEIL